ncbi:MAG: S8 family serine peptidase [Clostridia bacterium]|nr:S8 family serine peptidase [Clostridia bacterium]
MSKRLTALALTLLMLLSALACNASAAENISNKSVALSLNSLLGDDAVLRAIVVYKGGSDIAVDQSFGAPFAKTAKKLFSSQRSRLTSTITENYGASIVFNYGALINGVALDVSYGQLNEIEKLEGVEKVYIANIYSAPAVENVISPAAVSSGGTLGFTAGMGGGKGTVIAVLDTGININHKSFDPANISESAVIDQNSVNAKKSANGLLGRYHNSKIPYVYDYANGDTDISSSDSHGTAVASIAAGDDGSGFSGIAPDAQILGMKIFGDNGYTDSSVYFAAMEDAYVLGADVINLSLGSQNGFSFDYELETELYGNIFKRLEEAGVFVCCAAGNEFSQGYGQYAYNHASLSNYEDAVTIDYADYGVIGNPASYVNAIAVASGENSGYTPYTITVGGKQIEYTDAADGAFMYAFSGQNLEYVIVPSIGRQQDYVGIDVQGKVAVVARGEITFEEKCNAAAAAGAVALLCYNNEHGIVYMQIENPAIPCISVASNAYAALAENNRFTVDIAPSQTYSPYGVLISDFSSWGVTPDLKLKPQITAIGGSVRCASNSTSGYQILSGTSMATPVMSGIFACAKSYLKAKNLSGSSSNKQLYEMVYDTVLSSAELLVNESAIPYSPRRQGAGLPLFDNFVNTPAAFEEPVVNLGDDPQKSGVYTFTAKVKNLYGEEFTLSAEKSYVLCDEYIKRDGVLYNSLSPHLLDAEISVKPVTGDFADGVYTVAADNLYTELDITVKLSTADREYLSVYTNGAYVEGYIYLSVNGGISHIKQSFMGFYGDWTAAPAFEAYDWGAVVDAEAALVNEGYESPDYKTVLNTNVGYNEAYLTEGTDIVGVLGDNIYGYVGYNYDRMAFPTEESTSYNSANSFTFYPSLLRNVRHIIMTVSNAETGDIYYVDDTEYAMKNFYNTQSGRFDQGTYFTWDGTYYKNGSFAYVKDGTKLKVTFQTQLDYEGAVLVTEREYFIYVDNCAPEFECYWDAENKLLTVRATDKRYISNIFVYGDDGITEISRLDITDSVPNEYGEWTIDLSQSSIGDYREACVKLMDYASNYKSMRFDVGISTEPPSSSDGLKGDVNSDGTADNLDAAYVLRYDAEIITFTAKQLEVGDTNGDGTVDSLDAAAILRYDVFGTW